MAMLQQRPSFDRPEAQAPEKAWEQIAEDLRRKGGVKDSDEFTPAALMHVGFIQDELVQKARLERLDQLLHTACPGAPREQETAEPTAEEFDALLCGGANGTGVLRGMMRKLGLDCQRESRGVHGLVRSRIKKLEHRREAASMLMDEMEKEVIAVGYQMSEQVSTLTKLSGGQNQLMDDDSSCLEHLIPTSPCGGTASRTEVTALLPPGPELRCELREQLKQAQEDLEVARAELAAAKKVGASAWESVKQVLQDSQPEASLLDGRRALLAFARGKTRGTMIAEKLLAWDLRRKSTQAALFAWQTVIFSRRHAYRFKAYLDGRSQTELLEAVFQAWRHTVLQIWSTAAEGRLRRFDQILLRISARLLAGDGRTLQHLLFAQWRQLVRPKAIKATEPEEILKPAQAPKKCCCCVM